MVSPWKVYGPSTSTCCGSNRRDMSSECSGQCHRSKGLCKKVHPPGEHFACWNQELFGESASIQCHVCVPPDLLKILPRSLFSELYPMFSRNSCQIPSEIADIPFFNGSCCSCSTSQILLPPHLWRAQRQLKAPVCGNVFVKIHGKFPVKTKWLNAWEWIFQKL